MLLEWDLEGSKSYLERLRGVSCSIGKRGRSLGIRCVFRVRIVLLLSSSSWLLTVPLLQIGKESFEGLTDLLLWSEWLTDPLLRSGNALRDPQHVLDQLAPMSYHFWGSPSI